MAQEGKGQLVGGLRGSFELAFSCTVSRGTTNRILIRSDMKKTSLYVDINWWMSNCKHQSWELSPHGSPLCTSPVLG
jgi:hypothetical protein